MKKLTILIMILVMSAMITGCSPYNAGIKNLEKGEYFAAIDSFNEAIAKEKNLAALILIYQKLSLC